LEDKHQPLVEDGVWESDHEKWYPAAVKVDARPSSRISNTAMLVIDQARLRRLSFLAASLPDETYLNDTLGTSTV
jgi:hypothetical protein